MTDLVSSAMRLRPVAAMDADACHVLSRAVGWPYRVEDWHAAIALGHGLVGELDGAIVATASWWAYGETHATTGMIIVLPVHQGAGIGRTLMAAVLEQTKDRSLILHATAAGTPLYARFGFVPAGTILKHQGEVAATLAPVNFADATLTSVSGSDVDLLATLDQQASGLARGAMLQALNAAGDTVVLARQGRPVGFSIARRFGQGIVVGPLIAESEDDAKLLIGYWLEKHRGGFVRIDIAPAPGLEMWLGRQGLTYAGSVTAMVRGVPPKRSGPARVFALASQSLG